MAKLRNIDLKANPQEDNMTENALNVRADVCPCGATVCDYAATLTAAVTAVNLDGDFDGDELDLPAASYAVTSPGAAALQAALKTLLAGVAASVAVTFNATPNPDEMTVTVTGSYIELKNLNGNVNFTKTNCRAAE